MERLLDALDSAAGWTATGLSLMVNQHEDYVAGRNSASLMISFPAGSKNKFAVKSIAADVSDAAEITFAIKSFRYPIDSMEDGPAYSIELASGQSFKVPNHSLFTAVTIPVDGFSAITEFKVTALTDAEDVIVISNLLAVRPELPLDVITAVKLGLQDQQSRLFGLGKQVGKVTASAGDEGVTVRDNYDWVMRYAVITIVGLDRFYVQHQETHQVDATASGVVSSFFTTFDGRELLYEYIDADVYVAMPVTIGRFDREVTLPGVMLWYNSPTPSSRASRAARETFCSGPLGKYVHREGMHEKWRVVLENDARSPELLGYTTEFCRAFLARSALWVHGRKYWFEWTDPAVDGEPVEAVDVLPRATYEIDIEIKESTWELQRTVPMDSRTATVEPLPP